MSGILVVAEHEGGAFSKSAAELLGKAAELAAVLGAPVSAAVLGDGADPASLGAHGAAKAYHVAGDFSTYDAGATIDALAAVIEASGADIVIAPASYACRDALPRLTARFDGAMASDCMDLQVASGHLVARRPTFAGSIEADLTLVARPAFATVRNNAFPAPTPSDSTAEVEQVSFERTTPTVEVVETLEPDTKGIDLGTADKVVAGGRSLGSQEKFDELIRILGEVMGAGVGASRAATDAGYAPHAEQVGQTGQVVSPSLYLAVGISGAIQHLAGMRTSKVIVAINKDPDAPIFEHASYGIVDDLFDVVPALTEELRG